MSIIDWTLKLVSNKSYNRFPTVNEVWTDDKGWKVIVTKLPDNTFDYIGFDTLSGGRPKSYDHKMIPEYFIRQFKPCLHTKFNEDLEELLKGS